MSSDDQHMLIAGATGVAARRLIDLVSATAGWTVTGLCRNPPRSQSPRLQYVSADLTDADSCRRAVDGLNITHLVYAARAPHRLYKDMRPYEKVGIEDVGPNVTMLRNIVEACEGSSLQHVHALAGSKWYGIHLGPVRTPMLESDPGHMPPNFYFDQQKFLMERSSRGWSWSTSRPSVISGAHAGSGPDLMSAIGVYAAICRHAGLNFDFPGKPGTYTSLQEHTDAQLLAEAIFFISTTAQAQNQPFNVTNGDFYRWENLWPRLAEHFGLKMGRVRHFSLVQWMADKGPLWDEIVKIYGLVPQPIEKVASWAYADFILGWDYDVISSTTRIRKAGFHRVIDTEDMMLDQLSFYRRTRILP